MKLTTYQRMRDFSSTPEPKGKVTKRDGGKLEFVVQKHHASHLHYDFRLEVDGVLKSWAVPKGPSMDPADKRLAVMTEDHPYDYRKFEGVIPSGYGKGEVIIWDRGTYEPVAEGTNPDAVMRNELKKGKLVFKVHGEKLHGIFSLVKFHGGDDNWLLIKKHDDAASDDDITELDESVISGRTVEELGHGINLSKYPKSKLLTDIKPMLATLVDEPFDKKGWLFEIKWDGYRAIASKDGKETKLYSRSGQDFKPKYAPVAEALKSLRHDVVLDGELVVVDKDGRPDFNGLQNWQRKDDVNLVYYVFDLLWADGHDLRRAPLRERKQLLKQILGDNEIIRYADHIEEKGLQFYKQVEKQHIEGMVAKDAGAAYQEDVRSEGWLKVKTQLRQEAVICGYTEPRGSRKYLGSLLLGVYKDDELTYVGHSGGGMPAEQLKSLQAMLSQREINSSPFKHVPKPNAPVHWVRPELICEVTFAQWTPDGLMRQPKFIALRTDKPAQQVHEEQPKLSKSIVEDSASNHIKFTNRDKLFWPERSYTKGDLIDYYTAVSPHMFKYLKDRPQVLLRHPNGYAGPSFFQKDFDNPPDWVQTTDVYSESTRADVSYLVANTPDVLPYMAQLGCIEINPWHSRVPHLDKPDWLVFDLDPEAVDFKEVIKTAQAVRKLTEELGIPAFPKTSGKRGLHMYIPLNARYDTGQIEQFAELLARLIHERLPDITSLERLPKKRQGKVYLDYLRNTYSQTLAAAYSVRPTIDASVSTPLDWSEVKIGLDPTKFTIKSVPERIEKVGDLWEGVMGKGIDIKKIIGQIT